MTTTNPVDDFEAAKAIVQQLNDRTVERQERVLRWVAEGLGIALNTPVKAQQEARPQAVGATESISATQAARSPAHADIKSFIADKNPRGDIHFAAAVAYYYRFEAPPDQRRDTIDAKVLQDTTRLVKRARLKSPTATLNNAKKQGYLDSSTRGEFAINTVGENLVAMILPGGGDSVPPPPTARTKRKRKRKKVSKARQRRRS